MSSTNPQNINQQQYSGMLFSVLKVFLIHFFGHSFLVRDIFLFLFIILTTSPNIFLSHGSRMITPLAVRLRAQAKLTGVGVLREPWQSSFGLTAWVLNWRCFHGGLYLLHSSSCRIEPFLVNLGQRERQT